MLQVATNNSNIKASKEQNKKLKGNLGGSNMKLQLALDDITLEDAVELLDKVHPYVDIIEVGSPFIIEEGMRPVRIFKEKYPDCEILADTKIMDAGEYEAEETFKAGADYCTVLGVTDTLTIEGCVKAAKEYGKQTMVDMICVEDVPKRVKEIEAVGVDFIGVHVGVDQQAVESHLLRN